MISNHGSRDVAIPRYCNRYQMMLPAAMKASMMRTIDRSAVDILVEKVMRRTRIGCGPGVAVSFAKPDPMSCAVGGGVSWMVSLLSMFVVMLGGVCTTGSKAATSMAAKTSAAAALGHTVVHRCAWVSCMFGLRKVNLLVVTVAAPKTDGMMLDYRVMWICYLSIEGIKTWATNVQSGVT